MNVLVADPSPLMLRALSLLLDGERGVHVVGAATTVEAAVRLAVEVRPDVAVISSTFARAEVFAHFAACVVVASGEQDDATAARAALFAGALGFIRRHATPEELLESIRRVARGKRYLDPALGATVLQLGREATVASGLTSRQRDVLRMLAAGHTNREIADALGVSRRTVEGHRSELLAKTGASSRAGLVRYAREHGLHPPVDFSEPT